MKSGVYIIKNKITNDVYVGSSSNLTSRWGQHKYTLRHKTSRNMLLQNAWDEYGEEAFEFKILALIPRELLLSIEQQLIDGLEPAYNITTEIGKFPPSWEEYKKTAKYKEDVSSSMKKVWMNPKYRENYSIKRKGQPSNRKGAKLSDEQRKYLSEINKGENNPNWGKHRSKESRNKLAKTYPGAISPDGTIYSPIINLQEFCRIHNLDNGSMCRLMQGKCVSYKGWKSIE